MSSPGKHDGLYWPTKAGEPQSPLGELVARASGEGYSADKKERPDALPRLLLPDAEGPGGERGKRRLRLRRARTRDRRLSP